MAYTNDTNCHDICRDDIDRNPRTIFFRNVIAERDEFR